MGDTSGKRRAALDALAALDVCLECGGPVEHGHHVVPRSRGGTVTVPLCSKCHGKAHNQTTIGLGLERKRLRCFAGEIDRTAAGIDYGYRPTAEGGIERDDGGEWDTLQRIFALHDEGFGVRAITKKLIEGGVLGRKGQALESSNLAALIRKSGRECKVKPDGGPRGLHPKTLAAREVARELRRQGRTYEQIAEVLRSRFPGPAWQASRICYLVDPPKAKRALVRHQRQPNRRPDSYVMAELAVRALRSEGLSIPRIATVLRQTTVATASGRPWSAKGVEAILLKKYPTDLIVGADAPGRAFAGIPMRLL